MRSRPGAGPGSGTVGSGPGGSLLGGRSLAGPGGVAPVELRAGRAEPPGQRSPREAGLARARCRQRRAHPGWQSMHQPENRWGPLRPLHGGGVPFPVREHCQQRRWSPVAGGPCAQALQFSSPPRIARSLAAVLAEGHGRGVRPDRRTGTTLPERPAVVRTWTDYQTNVA